MKPIDIVSIICLVGACYSGWRKGFITELFSLSACLVAIVGVLNVLGRLTDFIHNHTASSSLAPLTPYVLFIVLSLLIVMTNALVGKFFNYITHTPLLGIVDKVIGAVVGTLKWTLLLSAFFSLAELVSLEIVTHMLPDSQVVPIIKPLLPCFFGWLSNTWPVLARFLKDVWSKDRLVVGYGLS